MFKPQLFPLPSADPDRSMQTKIHLEIPNQYHQEPIISELAKRFNLDVNILAAVLGGNGRVNGWFQLSLVGAEESIQDALIYLSELNIRVLDAEPDGW